MMDFELTDEQRLLEQSVREWGSREVAPYVRENDRNHHFDRDRILGGMARLGLLGISVPQEYGGAGMDYISLGLASEELEYVDTSLRVIMSVHAGLNCLSLLTWGSEQQKRRYLVPQAQGTRIAGYGLTEPSAGSDVRGMQTTATKRGDRYVLNGEKSWISLADVADTFMVIAWTDAEKKKQRDPSGLTAFIVERTFKGFSSGPMKEKWGILAGNTGWFKMADMEVPEENVLGRVGEGFKIAMFALDQGRFTVAAGATGLIRACRDASVKYALERKAFGVEIGQHQLVKEMIAQMESDYQAARLLWLRAGWLKNNGRRNAGREIAVANQPDAGSGGADVADQLLVPRSIQHDDHEVLDLTPETSGNRFKVVGRRRVQVDGVLRAWPDHQLLHVEIGRVQQSAAVRGREHGDGVRRTGRTQVRALERIDRDVHLRELVGGAVPVPIARMGHPDLLADVQHRRLVALALADHNRAVDRHAVHHPPHRLHGNLIGLVAVALAHRVRTRNGGLFDHAQEFEGKVRIHMTINSQVSSLKSQVSAVRVES